MASLHWLHREGCGKIPTLVYCETGNDLRALRGATTRARRESGTNYSSSDLDVATIDDVRRCYERSQILLVKNVKAVVKKDRTRSLNLDYLQHISRSHPKMVAKSFCIERKQDNFLKGLSKSKESLNAETILQSGDELEPWYCSFLVQHNESAIEDALRHLPISIPPCDIFSPSYVHHSKHIWMFFGRHLNRNKTHQGMLRGRPEHTDQVTHDGTWHYQNSGSKIWFVRPVLKMSDKWICPKDLINASLNSHRRFRIECEAGDMLFINTSLWFHQTRIPKTSAAQDTLSFSYARDFRMGKRSGETEDADEADMTNVDGLYAQKRIQAGEVVLTENDMPDCELPRAADPNCEIACAQIEGEEESEIMVLMARRDIKKGEWFTIAFDDEDENEDAEEDFNVNGNQLKRQRID